MTRIEIALPHHRTASSWGLGSNKEGPFRFLARKGGTSRDEDSTKQPYAEGELARRLDTFYKRRVPHVGMELMTPSLRHFNKEWRVEMAKIATAEFTGKSGHKYSFDVYHFGQAFNAVGAVYIFTTRTVANGAGSHAFAYIGQTGDLSERFDNHHKAVAIKAQNPNCVCIHVENNEGLRRAIETDLIACNKTPCNG